MTSPTDGTIRWLLEGDPAIRWQVRRDLLGAAQRSVERERRKVAREGWGVRLLARQDPEGTWAGGMSSDGGLYSPKWISTTYTMLLLRDSGLPTTNPQARKACGLLLDGGLQRDGGINYGWRGTSETCITGMVLSILSYFEYDDVRLDTIADHLLEQQMPDGGWNCQRPYGATHASVHTTISVLEGLRFYEHRGRKVRPIRAAQRRGREFLLVHRLFRCEIIDSGGAASELDPGQVGAEWRTVGELRALCFFPLALLDAVESGKEFGYLALDPSETLAAIGTENGCARRNDPRGRRSRLAGRPYGKRRSRRL